MAGEGIDLSSYQTAHNVFLPRDMLSKEAPDRMASIQTT